MYTVVCVPRHTCRGQRTTLGIYPVLPLRELGTQHSLSDLSRKLPPLTHLIGPHLCFHCLLSQEFVINMSVCGLMLVLKMLDLEDLGSLCNYVLNSENARATNPNFGLMSETPVKSACG